MTEQMFLAAYKEVDYDNNEAIDSDEMPDLVQYLLKQFPGGCKAGSVVKSLVDNRWYGHINKDVESFDKNQTLSFIQKTLSHIKFASVKLEPAEYDNIYKIIDEDETGTIDKVEMVEFITLVMEAVTIS